ncbi:hypothetical protein B0T24DRAFT_633755 [Lasiosphaeria ovina]|uniref:MFS maltose permease n=1 Tax=Lasiosphaeria ovina TaxID=92902 RepID=A0AAE0N2B6_9PEZI|nr:hypothetical protein B0T24DRAFT_633755 [Lasiosphaeria ovina]
MRPRLALLRRVLARKLQSPPLRSFAGTSIHRTRPQLPFLSVPTRTRAPHQFRYLTTERKARLKYEIKLGIKYTSYLWLAAGAVLAAGFAISQESLERQYPTPHEWSFLTRMRFRGAFCTRDQTNPHRATDWVAVMQWIKGSVERLENPGIDGKGVRDAPSNRPHGTKDIGAMPESWRRGYYETMMIYAKASEHCEGWVIDKTRNMIFPPGVMIGPSNPRPRPLPAGFHGAPKEENCEFPFETPDDVYLRIISTEGLTNRQRMDAGLAYASWLEFKGIAGPAGIMYEDAVQLALSELPSAPTEPLDSKTWTLKEDAGEPSANLLTALTAYATYRARQGDVSSALPIFVSILKARRSLPTLADSVSNQLWAPRRDTSPATAAGAVSGLGKSIISFFGPPPYPPPPDDGVAPPIRDAKELCEEAALSLHIGEIMYTAPNGTSREEGLSWTREAVDVAEEQLHKLTSSAADKPAFRTCRDCLSSGLQNWSTMVAQLARDEAAKTEVAKAKKSSSAWLSLWGSETKKEDTSRWAAEEKVIQERERRAKDLLDELRPPGAGLASLFTA